MKQNLIFNCLCVVILLHVSAFSLNKTAQNNSNTSTSSGDRIVLNAEQIREMNVQSIPELLNRLPGISAGDTYAKIQGASDVRALLDGRPMNDPSSAHGGIKWNMVSIHDVDKIEILMGGGAAAVGDGTSGGAIIITTRKQAEAHGNIELSAGNYGTENLSVRFGQNVNAVSMGATGIYDHTDGYRINNDKTKKQATARLELKGDSLSTEFSLGYASDDRGYPGKPQWPTPLARAVSECINGAWTGKVRSFSSNIYFSKDTKTTDDPQQPLKTNYDGWSAGAKAGGVLTIGKFGSINTGLEGRYEDASGFREAKEGGVLKNREYAETEWSTGAWATKNLTVPLKPVPCMVTAGARVNYYSAFSANVNPELRIRFSPGPLSFNLGAAIMHNTPNLSKRYYESSTTMKNPDLKPERGTNTALGMGYTMKKNLAGSSLVLSCNAQGYYNLIDDRITYITSSKNSQGIYDNVGHVVRRGIDLSLGIRIDSLLPFCDMNIDAALGLLDARDLETDLFLTASPKYESKISLGLKLFKILSLRLIGEYDGEQFTTSDNLSTSDPHFVCNGNADLVLKRMAFYVKVENILDSKYTYSDGYPGAPREYVAGVRCEF